MNEALFPKGVDLLDIYEWTQTGQIFLMTGIRDTAKKMLLKKHSVDSIIDITDLTAEEIAGL